MATLNSAQDTEVSFITGVTAGGTIAETSFWTWNNDNPGTYSTTQSFEAKWGARVAGTPSGTITYAFDAASAWTPVEQNAFQMAMALWSAEANITFAPVAGTDTANLTLTRGTDGGAAGGISRLRLGAIDGSQLGQAVSAGLHIDTSKAGFGPLGASFTDFGGYPWQTMLHELGHTLGLGHAGAYNGTADPSTQQQGPYDNRAYSIMSYIDPQDANPAMSAGLPSFRWGSSKSDDGLFYRNVAVTPMMLDIVAMQRLYGAPTSGPLSSGGQVFGFNTNIGGLITPFFDFTQNTKPIVTLYDGGHNNTLDLSGYGAASNIDLHDGAFSSCAGLTNNLCIALGTAIDTAIGGSAGDAITANDDGDTIIGGGGGDALFAGAGADVFRYQAYSDSTAANPDGVFGFQTGVDRVDLTALQTSAVSLERSGGSTFLFADGAGGHLQINLVGAGVNANDVITGTTHGFYLIGDNAGDTLIGSAQGDAVQGGTGNDTLIGGAGADALFSGGGADTFVYQTYADSTAANPDGVFGFVSGLDKVDLSALALDAISLIRSGGSTFLFGDGAGGHVQINFVSGQVNATDLITGTTHGIYLIGDNSGDTLIGSAFGDPIQGGSGNDLIIGGGGGDALFGGGGANTFKYVAASDSTATASDSIFDFKAGIDKIDLSAVRESSTDVFGILSQSGSSFLFVKLDPGQADEHDMTIILNGTPSITANDIIWGTAPTHDIGATIATSPIGETMPTAKTTGSSDGTVTHSLLDSGSHLTALDVMPTPSHLADPFEHYFLGPLNQHVAELIA